MKYDLVWDMDLATAHGGHDRELDRMLGSHPTEEGSRVDMNERSILPPCSKAEHYFRTIAAVPTVIQQN